MTSESRHNPSLEADDRAALAHDIRQMLTVITGRAGLLMEKGIEGRGKHLEAILLAARDADHILARWASDGNVTSVSEAEAYDLRAAVHQSALLIRPGPDKDWTEEYATPGSGSWFLANSVPEGLIAGLPGQVLREVCCNLILNALEAMPQGGTISFDARAEESGLVLLVRDQGKGLDRTLGDRIWEPGISGSGRKGRGLGLAGCRKLLAEFGAEIEADGSVESGAAFRLDLPAGSIGDVSPGAEAPEDRGGRTMNILVVDDEAGVREMLADVLTELGNRAVCFRDGESALEAFRPGTIDLAVIDQQLPGIKGSELVSALKQRDRSLIAALVTGWDNQARSDEILPPEVDLKANKPLEIGGIRDLLNRARGLQAMDARFENKWQAGEGRGKG